MPQTVPYFVNAAWLEKNRLRDDIRILDSRWAMPNANICTRSLYREGHIPRAIRFHIDEVADQFSPYPHMLPNTDFFDETIGEMGISNNHHIIVYDDVGCFSAPRVWWTFRVMGHEKISILQGGLSSWKNHRLLLEIGTGPAFPHENFNTTLCHAAVYDCAAIGKALTSGTTQVVDARSSDRFMGTAPEPWQGRISGHMPGAKNLPFDKLLTKDKTHLLSNDELIQAFSSAGVDLKVPIVSSCGSGVTAAILSLALDNLGVEIGAYNALYDASWCEWGLPENKLAVVTD